MQRKSKIIIIFVLFILCFAKLIMVNTFFVFGLEKYLGENWWYIREKMYNSLLERDTDPDRARNIIDFLETHPIEKREQETYELLGDVSLVTLSDTGSAIRLYEKSESYRATDRVRAKLALLSPSSPSSSWSEIAPLPKDRTGSTVSTGWLVDTWAKLIEEARLRTEKDSKNRGEYVSLSPDDSLILRDTINFLDTNTERVDW